MAKKDWTETAKLIADDSLGIRKEDQILLVVGDGIERAEGVCDLYAALKEELYDRGFLPTIISYRAGAGVEPPALVEEACCGADVIITMHVRGFLHSAAFPRVQKNKKPDAKVLMLPTSNADGYMERLMPKTKEAFYEVAEITQKIGGRFLGGPHTVRLSAPNGTDLTFSIGQLNGWNHTGIGKKPGSFAMLPAGTLNVGVDEGSAEGTLVVDTFTATKDEPLRDKIVFEIHDGYAASITGSFEAEDFLAAAEKVPGTPREKFCVAEFGLGFVRAADYHISLGDGEHVFGGAHIGIGSNVSFGGNTCIASWHSDSLILHATVELDGVRIEENGNYLV